MTTRLTIEFISDITCPWCVIGLNGLTGALERLRDQIEPELELQPFELNPALPPGGLTIEEQLALKYEGPVELNAETREAIRLRGLEGGFVFNMETHKRIYNTFDAHRVLYWAGLEGRRLEMLRALYSAYFTDAQDPGDPDVVAAAATRAGLDPQRAREVLGSGAYVREVRTAQRRNHDRNIHAVPVTIINDRFRLAGALSADGYEQAFRQVLQRLAQP